MNIGPASPFLFRPVVVGLTAWSILRLILGAVPPAVASPEPSQVAFSAAILAAGAGSLIAFIDTRLTREAVLTENLGSSRFSGPVVVFVVAVILELGFRVWWPS